MTEQVEVFTTFEQAADFVKGLRLLGLTPLLLDEGEQFSVVWSEWVGERQ